MREARRLKGWTQARLAKRLGLSRETISRLERSRRKPTSDTVFRIEHSLELDLIASGLVAEWREWAPLRSSEPGPRSRERRRKLGMSLAGLGAAAGVSASTLSRFERQERRTPSLLRIETSELGGEWAFLRSERLATALGFASIEEHERYCGA